jgi:hypothetical protein
MLRHRGHNHWHFDAMAAYSLRRAGSTDVLAARDKGRGPTTTLREMLAEQPARDLTGLGGPLQGEPVRADTDETDNATSVAFRVDGTKIRKVSSAACR